MNYLRGEVSYYNVQRCQSGELIGWERFYTWNHLCDYQSRHKTTAHP